MYFMLFAICLSLVKSSTSYQFREDDVSTSFSSPQSEFVNEETSEIADAIVSYKNKDREITKYSSESDEDFKGSENDFKGSTGYSTTSTKVDFIGEDSDSFESTSSTISEIDQTPEASDTSYSYSQPSSSGYDNGNDATRVSPIRRRCGKYEQWTSCKYRCPRETCNRIYSKERCDPNQKCQPGCVCIDGYYRNGTLEDACILEADCPRSTPIEPQRTCQQNEEYQTCGTACPDTCDNYRDNGRFCTLQCVIGCFCKKGFVRSPDGKSCIRPQLCSVIPLVCDINEEFSYCDSECPAQTCDSILSIYDCSDLNKECIPRCRCKDGYLRNGTINDPCILSERCPILQPQCNANEEYKECGTACPATCDNYQDNALCTQQCVSGCFCKNGFVKTASGECVTPDQCPARKCRGYEMYSKCGSICEKTCDNYNRKPGVCATICVEGCFCRPGLVRAKDGSCVPPDVCRFVGTCSGPNEVWSVCQYECPPQNCANYTYPIMCFAPDNCNKAGCNCIPGYVRDENNNNICIPQEQCRINQVATSLTQSCGKHEIFTSCYPVCPVKNCATKNLNLKCLFTVPPSSCKPGCVCEDGYVRLGSADSPCVLENECPIAKTSCGLNEEYTDCGSACPQTCENYLDQNSVCTAQCVKGCFCKNGYVKSSDGTCVRPQECPSRRCSNKEVYLKCGTCERTCDNYNRPGMSCSAACIDGCFCRRGLVRARDGSCVPPSQCHRRSRCGINEEFKRCGTACPLTCDNYQDGNRICTRQCVEGCFCKEGFVKSADGTCVRRHQCPLKQCKSNEVYLQCGSCEKTCQNYNRTDTVCAAVCVEGCFCEKGLVRADDGSCVAPYLCNEANRRPPLNIGLSLSQRSPGQLLLCFSHPSTSRARLTLHQFVNSLNKRPNNTAMIGGCRNDEIYKTCGSACPATCDNYDDDNTACIALCVAGCFCRDGLIRAPDGSCVKPNQCPPKKCRGYEEYAERPNYCDDTCASYGAPDKNSPVVCNKGCFCRQGLVRAFDGSCVPPNVCPFVGTCSGPNEVWSVCRYECPPQNCANYLNPILCFAPDQCSQAGCNCIPGYVRDETNNNICIPQEQCRKRQTICPFDNEEYKTCGSACPPSCENLQDPNRVCTTECVEGCFCKAGLVRSPDGTCVYPNQCNVQDCGENQVYKTCGTACPDTCDNYGDSNRLCTKNCVQGCFCRPGFVKAYDGTCVLPENCPLAPSCGINEYYHSCFPECPDQTCLSLYRAVRCRQPISCKPGCVCKENYLRNGTNSFAPCVHKTECPSLEELFPCNYDEEYKACGSACPATCDNYQNPEICTSECVKGCFCREGLVRGPDGSCISPDQCESTKCPINEVYKSCGTACPDTCDNYRDANRVCTDQCVKGCFCAEGRVRAADGSCLYPQECPVIEQDCGVNEKWYYNYPECPGQLCATRFALVNCIQPIKTYPGCYCIENYRRNGTDMTAKCIPENDCPPFDPHQCNEDEEYKQCGTACPATCDNLNRQNEPCTLQCVEGCFCKEGLVKAADGSCVPPEQCQNTVQQCGANEEYTPCYPVCPVRTCASKNLRIRCGFVIPKSSCKPGCVCKDNYVRSDGSPSSPCVLEQECPVPNPTSSQTCGENEIWVDSYPECPSQTCLSKYILVKCATPIKSYAQCICKPNYLRNGTSVGAPCIPSEYCPPPPQPPVIEPQCGENEFWNEKGKECPPQTCIQINARYPCDEDQPYKPGCYCIDNYLRNGTITDKCIQTELCPNYPAPKPEDCAIDEVWDACGTACPDTCDNYKDTGRVCTDDCVVGCFCMDGLVRGPDGDCVSPETCCDE